MGILQEEKFQNVEKGERNILGKRPSGDRFSKVSWSRQKRNSLSLRAPDGELLRSGCRAEAVYIMDINTMVSLLRVNLESVRHIIVSSTLDSMQTECLNGLGASA